MVTSMLIIKRCFSVRASGGTLKRKVALVGGYIGTGYHGLQINHNDPDAIPTIENEFRKALTKAGHILDTNSHDLNRIKWSRSSRTDKGVHAGRIVFSAKLELPTELVESRHLGRSENDIIRFPEVVANTNKYLPENIRLFCCIKVGNSFCARENGKWRAYEYIFPFRLLYSEWNRNQTPERILQSFNQNLQQFEGNHNFHNFHRMSSREYKKKPKHQSDHRNNKGHVETNDNVAKTEGNPSEIDEKLSSIETELQKHEDQIDIEDDDYVEEIEEEIGQNENDESVVELNLKSETVEQEKQLSKDFKDQQSKPYDPWFQRPRDIPMKVKSTIYRCQSELFHMRRSNLASLAELDHNNENKLNDNDNDDLMVKVHIIGKSFLLQ
jgi:tRNA pseudouridine(38-40) synthase